MGWVEWVWFGPGWDWVCPHYPGNCPSGWRMMEWVGRVGTGWGGAGRSWPQRPPPDLRPLPAAAPVTLDVDGEMALRSRDFPDCCTKEDYVLRASGGSFLRLVFEDIDLPPGSQLTVSTLRVSQRVGRGGAGRRRVGWVGRAGWGRVGLGWVGWGGREKGGASRWVGVWKGVVGRGGVGRGRDGACCVGRFGARFMSRATQDANLARLASVDSSAL